MVVIQPTAFAARAGFVNGLVGFTGLYLEVFDVLGFVTKVDHANKCQLCYHFWQHGVSNVFFLWVLT